MQLHVGRLIRLYVALGFPMNESAHSCSVGNNVCGQVAHLLGREGDAVDGDHRVAISGPRIKLLGGVVELDQHHGGVLVVF